MEFLNCSDENCIWFKVENTLLDCNCVFGAVYIPPEGSPYSSIDIFDKIEQDVINFHSDNLKVGLFGDFNARSGLLDDFVEVDHHIARHILDTDTEMILNKNNLEMLGFPYKRFSEDKFCNNYGRRLIDLCKSLDVHIVNGRIGLDSYIGKATCKGVSLVDYVICNPEVFPCISHFEILPFDPLLSDVHSAISFCLRAIAAIDCTVSENEDVTDNTEMLRATWDNEAKLDFVNNIDLSCIDSLCLDIDNSVSNSSFTTDFVNNVTVATSKLLTDAAEKCNMLKMKKAGRQKRKSDKPWFDDDVKSVQNEYHTARKNFRKTNSQSNYDELKAKSKNYKKMLSHKMKDYYNDVAKRLRNLRHSCPKDYWCLLNKFSAEKKDVINKVSLDVFYQHFCNLNNDDLSDVFDSFDVNNVSDVNVVLNKSITVEEIVKAIKLLKNSKACSPIDNVLNEYIKYSSDTMSPLYCKLFNLVLDSGIVPDAWCTGVILPIYKNKGEENNPDNYRGITILSCLGKLFTSVLNNRISLFMEEYSLLAEEQAGFRHSYSTVDHIFSLKMLIDIYLSKNKKLYCSFIDYKKAFDSVNRSALWLKLLENNIDGKILKVIHNIYDKAKSQVKVNNKLSDTFVSLLGVRQGENLSPILFSIFLNDLVTFMSKDCEELSLLSNIVNEQLSDDTIEVFLKLYLLLYADDTVIFSETPDGLQKALNCMYNYCNQWHLTVNPDKTKIVVFSKGKIRRKPVFYYNDLPLEAVDDFSYLGVKFNFNGKFSKTKKFLTDQARKAMFSVMTKIKKMCLPIDIQLQLFDSMISPILLYGCEVWGCEDISIISQFQMKFYKYILNLKMSTPSVMVMGELGTCPIENNIYCRMLNFWAKLVSGNPNKICCILYRTMYTLHEKNIICNPWIAKVKTLLDNLGCSEYWHTQTVPNCNVFKCKVKTILKDQYLQSWNSNVFQSSKCINYRMYKSDYKLEPYMLCLPRNLSIALCKFRCNNFNLPIEKGRYFGLSRQDRLCHLCNRHEIGDEFHYIFNCTFFANDRRKYIAPHYYRYPNVLNFQSLMCNTDKNVLVKLAVFVKTIMLVLK